jgi:hypothetical protein
MLTALETKLPLQNIIQGLVIVAGIGVIDEVLTKG